MQPSSPRPVSGLWTHIIPPECSCCSKLCEDIMIDIPRRAGPSRRIRPISRLGRHSFSQDTL
ncbi:hypothetical protein U0070_025704 [Myodes glareolus]|uniref:Uncharacterized protein n=1 Tax=Myodes glareolus TaxID=447135 RepID=A0AAW0HNM0_MYOGA